jgi:predicted short-subunit dehydrogenase-like oxidoreductase (DUF2520 family)
MIQTAAVLGGGAVARALLDALPAAGVRVLASWNRGSGLEPPPLRDVDVVLLAVSDQAIASVCRRLEVGGTQLVAHLAGALGLSPLRSARLKGARTGSVHPLRAFTRGEIHDFRGATAGIIGSDSSASADLAALASRLGMVPLMTTAGSRALYHAAAVLAAGGQVALFAEAVRAFRKATGASEPEARNALLPLALGALEKLGREPPEAVLTGPATRGDQATIDAHRRALPRDLVALYDELTAVARRLRTRRAEVPRAEAPKSRSSRRGRPRPAGGRPSASSRSPARRGPRREPPRRGRAPRRRR